MFHSQFSILNSPFSAATAALLSVSLLHAAPADTNTSTNTNTTLSLDDLGVITVTAADRVSTPLRDTTANVTVISAEEIKERGYRTLADALSRVSGFAAASNGGAGQTTGLYLRGMKQGSVLILLDGIPMKDPNDPSFSYPLEHLMLDNVKRIEVVKGAQSGLWGSDAVAGVVNIVTKEAAPGAHAVFRGGLGSHTTRTGGVDLSYSGEAGSFLISGDHYETDGFSALKPRNAEADGYTNDTLHIKGRLKTGEDSSLGLFYHQIDGDFDYDGNGNPDDTSTGSFSDRLTGLEWNYDDGRLSMHGLLSVNTVERHYNDAVWVPSDYTGDATRAALNAAYTIDDRQRISGGVEYNRYQGSSTWNPVQASYDNRAIFGSYRYIWDDLLGARTVFNATLRYDDFSHFDNKATYRFGLKRECRLLPGLFTAANIYSAYKAPDIYRASRPLPGTTLKPEYTRGYELTIGYEKYLTVTYFRNKISDEIISAGGWPPFYTNDPRSYTVSGLEIGSEWSFREIPLTLSANYTHLFDTEDKNGAPLYRRPENSFNLFLDYALTDRITLGADLRYVGKRVDRQWVGWIPQDVTLGSYSLVNLHYNHRITDKLTLSIQARNILDEEYETAAGYSTEGRSVYGTVEYRF
jgi:vitamin B12 transporter